MRVWVLVIRMYLSVSNFVILANGRQARARQSAGHETPHFLAAPPTPYTHKALPLLGAQQTPLQEKVLEVPRSPDVPKPLRKLNVLRLNADQKTHSFHLDVIGVMMTKLICSASSPVTIQLTCPGPPLLGEYYSLMIE